MRPTLVVFASGTASGGGSGFENLVQASRRKLPFDSAQGNSPCELDAEIVAVVSNHERGGVAQRAQKLGIPFIYMPAPWDAEHYQQVVADAGAEWVALSGWLKKVEGLDPRRTFNIHPALLSDFGGRFGGPGMYGHRVHAAVADAFEKGQVAESGITMHFVTDLYDRGPAFFEYRVPLEEGMTPEEIAAAVNKAEHEWQPKITNMVVHGEIAWDGKDPHSLNVPDSYEYLPKS